MNISEIFVRRPIGTSLLMAGILVFGLELPVAAGRSAANRRFPDHPGIGAAAGRQPGDHRLLGGDAAGAAICRHSRARADDLDQRTWNHEHHAAIRSEPQHRRCRRRRADGNQRGQWTIAERLAESADLARRPTRPIAPILIYAVYSDAMPLYRVDDYAYTIMAQRISQIGGGVTGRISPVNSSTPCMSRSTRPRWPPAVSGLKMSATRHRRRSLEACPRATLRVHARG